MVWLRWEQVYRLGDKRGNSHLRTQSSVYQRQELNEGRVERRKS